MLPYDLFNMIKNIRHSDFTTGGDDVQWIVRIDDKEQVVRLIFEESAGKTDWKNNFKFPVKIYKKQQSCLKVAMGWGEAYKSCNDEIMRDFIKAVESNLSYDIQICGWSYGGAMSMLAAEDFFYRTHKKPTVITFGAPKPLFGKKSFDYVKSCIKEAFQYSHINDIVTLVPPFYRRINTIKVGLKRSLVKLCKPQIYHCIYGEKAEYQSSNPT